MGKPTTLRKRREQLHEADLLTDLEETLPVGHSPTTHEGGDVEDEGQDGQEDGEDADDV